MDGLQESFDAAAYFLDIVPAVEGRNAKEAFTMCTEPCTRGNDHQCFAEHFIEEIPAFHALRGLYPDVWSMDAAPDVQADGHTGGSQQPGIAEIEVNE